MTIERLPSRLGLPALLVLCALTAVRPAFGQVGPPAIRFQPLTAGHLSVSGAVAVGFAPYRADAPGRAPADLCAMLAPGSVVPPTVRPLAERMYLASPTFRRQWIRIVEARIRLRVSFDHARTADGSVERTIVNVGALQAHIQLRPDDPDLPEHLAHEIEHVLEHLDGVDLAQAAAGGVRGVTRTAGPMFETRRATVVGRIVAAELARFRAGS